MEDAIAKLQRLNIKHDTVSKISGCWKESLIFSIWGQNKTNCRGQNYCAKLLIDEKNFNCQSKMQCKEKDADWHIKTHWTFFSGRRNLCLFKWIENLHIEKEQATKQTILFSERAYFRSKRIGKRFKCTAYKKYWFQSRLSGIAFPLKASTWRDHQYWKHNTIIFQTWLIGYFSCKCHRSIESFINLCIFLNPCCYEFWTFIPS